MELFTITLHFWASDYFWAHQAHQERLQRGLGKRWLRAEPVHHLLCDFKQVITTVLLSEKRELYLLYNTLVRININ